MIDDFLDCFIRPEEEEDIFVATMVKRFSRVIPYEYESEQVSPFKMNQKNDRLKEERLARDLLKRYFLKAREYKTTKLGTIETLSMIAESFSQFRYFISNKHFHSGTRKS